MLEENKLLIILNDSIKQLRTLDASPNSDENKLERIKLKERIGTLSVVLGEERKKYLQKQITDLNVTENEAMKASLLVLEQLLIARGFTNREEMTIQMISAVKNLREKNGYITKF